MEAVAEEKVKESKPESSFKKPILVGKIGRLPRKITSTENVPVPEVNSEPMEIVDIPVQPPPVEKSAPESAVSLPYKEPVWSGLPNSSSRSYVFEVLKNGSIVETIDLVNKPFWVFGRLPNCDICMQHPTISRYHAILQYRSEKTETEDCGFYIYDLGSTHGTFMNKNKLKSRVYARIQVGHMLKLGCSTRTYILNGPDEDTEEESPLTVTELKQQRLEELRRREEAEKEAALKREQLEEQLQKKREERGIDWGLGEDADEETDLSENPYAQSNNEELYLDNPKKALRGYFEREGLELEYDCTEQGIGQFLCKVELPLDDEMGRPVIAEVVHKGKKKEAVLQCALEACRILDRHGVLRQATHESRKRKPKNWEDNDYYDSDDDTFLDRTGAIEKKREMRMKGKAPPKAETYESLLVKEKSLKESIMKVERELSEAQMKFNVENSSNPEQDPLDSFMLELKQSKPDKHAIIKLKTELAKLKQEHASTVKLVNIARPASLPPLVVDICVPSTSSSSSTTSSALPIFGKRKKIKLELPHRNLEEQIPTSTDGDEELEEEEPETPAAINNDNVEESNESSAQNSSEGSPRSGADSNAKSYNMLTLKKFEKILERQKLPPFADKHQDKLTKILHNLKKLACDGDRMDVDWKILEAKKKKVMKLISDLNSSEPDKKLEHKISSELNRILNELNTMTEHKFKVISKVKKMGNELKCISDEINTDLEKLKEEETLESETVNDEESGDVDKKKKKNQRRIQQRQEKADIEKQRGYDEDARREDYNMWVPPNNQSGDGRTQLNERFGY